MLINDNCLVHLSILTSVIWRFLHTYVRYKGKVIHLNLLSLLMWFEKKETLLPIAVRTYAVLGCLFLHELKCYSLSTREKYD